MLRDLPEAVPPKGASVGIQSLVQAAPEWELPALCCTGLPLPSPLSAYVYDSWNRKAEVASLAASGNVGSGGLTSFPVLDMRVNGHVHECTKSVNFGVTNKF